MVWRAGVTVVAWLLGLGAQYTDGQTFRNSIVLFAAALIGCLPWIPLAFRGRGTRGRLAAIIITSLSGIVIVLIALNLPEAYEYQKRFNESRLGREQPGTSVTK